MHASRNLSLPFDPSHNPKKRDKNRKNTPDSNESSFETRKPSLEFRETSNFQIHHSKGFRETIYFSRNIITIRTYSERTDQQPLRVHLCEVKF